MLKIEWQHSTGKLFHVLDHKVGAVNAPSSNSGFAAIDHMVRFGKKHRELMLLGTSTQRGTLAALAADNLYARHHGATSTSSNSSSRGRRGSGRSPQRTENVAGQLRVLIRLTRATGYGTSVLLWR